MVQSCDAAVCHTYSITQQPSIQHLSGTLNELKKEGTLSSPSPPPEVIHSTGSLYEFYIYEQQLILAKASDLH